MIPLQVPAYPG